MHKYIEVTNDMNLHTAEAMDDYLHCPMYWGFKHVYQQHFTKTSEHDDFWKVLLSFVRNDFENPFDYNNPNLSYELGSGGKYGLMYEHWADWLHEHIDKTRVDSDTVHAMVVDGMQILDSWSHIFFQKRANASFQTSFYVNRGNEHDGAGRITVSGILQPYQLIYVSPIELPIGKREARNSPTLYALASVNARIWNYIGNGPVYKAPRPIVLMPGSDRIHEINSDPTWYYSGPQWSRVLECMDALGIYLNVSNSCDSCQFKNICGPEKADIRTMKSKGPNKNVQAKYLKARKKTLDARDNPRPIETNDPNL